MDVKRTTGALLVACAAAAIGTVTAAWQAPAPAPGTPAAPQAAGRGGGRGSVVAPLLFTAADADKDGGVTQSELKAAFGKWYADADAAKAGTITQEQLSAVLAAALPTPPPDPAAAPAGNPGAGAGARGAGAAAPGGGASIEPVWGSPTPGLNDPCGGRSQTPTAACTADIEKMMAALPATAPAKPAKARKVLIWSRVPSAGFQHSSIPMAARTIEELVRYGSIPPVVLEFIAAAVQARCNVLILSLIHI